jgi:hypothetical protein
MGWFKNLFNPEPVVPPVELPKLAMTGLPVSVVVVPPGVNPERVDRNERRAARLREHIARESARGIQDTDLAAHMAELNELDRVMNRG